MMTPREGAGGVRRGAESGRAFEPGSASGLAGLEGLRIEGRSLESGAFESRTLESRIPEIFRNTSRLLSEVGSLAAGAMPRLSHHEDLVPLHLLVVDDDDDVRTACLEIAGKMGFVVVGAADLSTARSILKHQKVDVVLLDLKVPGGHGMSLLEEVKALTPDTSVVVMTAFATVSNAVEAMRVGAKDYLTKPFALDELVTILDRAGERSNLNLTTRRLRERLRNQKGVGHLIGRAPEMEKLFRIMSKVAQSTHPVLIVGETGTGKELVARSIHFHGPHPNRPFVPVDCKSLVPSMIESELFGYTKGAFLGANRTKNGLLAATEGGTVFLDEVGELSLELQAKLLRALQDKTVQPVGGGSAAAISARILAATNRDLSNMVEQGKFRKDLYFRLNVVNLRIPPLRDRREDIPVLTQHFMQRAQRENGIHHQLSDEALRAIQGYDWPGNVRELESAVERSCALSSGPLVHLGDLPSPLRDFRDHQRFHNDELGASEPAPLPVGKILSIAEMEKNAILGTIQQLHGDKLLAAKLLGIGKTTLYRKLKEYGIPGELAD